MIRQQSYFWEIPSFYTTKMCDQKIGATLSLMSQMPVVSSTECVCCCWKCPYEKKKKERKNNEVSWLPSRGRGVAPTQRKTNGTSYQPNSMGKALNLAVTFAIYEKILFAYVIENTTLSACCRTCNPVICSPILYQQSNGTITSKSFKVHSLWDTMPTARARGVNWKKKEKKQETANDWWPHGHMTMIREGTWPLTIVRGLSHDHCPC